MRKILVLSLILLCLSSFAQLSRLKKLLPAKSLPLTNTEIVNGLKDAILIGTDSAVTHLSAIDGYLKDQAVKILLPPEAKEITDNISKLPGGAKLIDDVIVRINRAAEDAAKGAKPIFISSVKTMTFDDGLKILKGPDNAATQYFRLKTNDQLAELYRPKLRESLNKDLVAGISTEQSWNELTTTWNKLAASPLGKFGGLKTVNVKLEDYIVQKALDGLYLKIEEREKDIRSNANARVTNVLKKVFGGK
jgi:hypothetical protein